MPGATTVWLVRHGQVDGVDGRCYGRHDVPLSAEGIQQANEAAKQLASEFILHIYSSNLCRAIQTAEIVARPHGLTVQTAADLAEMNFGDLEGMRYEDIASQFPDVFRSWTTRPTETQLPNGENFQQMSCRVLGALNVILERHRNESIAIVAHAGVLRIVLCRALSIPENEFFHLALPHGAINRIDYFEKGPVVELING